MTTKNKTTMTTAQYRLESGESALQPLDHTRCFLLSRLTARIHADVTVMIHAAAFDLWTKPSKTENWPRNAAINT